MGDAPDRGEDRTKPDADGEESADREESVADEQSPPEEAGKQESDEQNEERSGHDDGSDDSGPTYEGPEDIDWEVDVGGGSGSDTSDSGIESDTEDKASDVDEDETDGEQDTEQDTDIGSEGSSGGADETDRTEGDPEATARNVDGSDAGDQKGDREEDERDDESNDEDGDDGDDEEDDASDQDGGEDGSEDGDDLDGFGGIEGPESDEEMPLADHIEEMVRRLAIVLGIAGIVTLLAYPASEYLIEFLWQAYLPNAEENRPHIYGPLEYILTKLKVAGLAGTVVGLPVFVYQTYRFMRPGLYSTERRYYLASVPTSLVLACLGVVFAHLVILPLTMLYFTSYTAESAVVAFGLRETFNLIVIMMGYMAIVFQIPLFIMLAIMMGLVTRVWLEDKRLLFWAGFGGLAFTFVSVDPTGMAPIIISVTMIILFELTLLLLRWTGN